MSGGEHRHRDHATVLVAIDGSAASAAAARWAAGEAERRHARLHAVHVVGEGRTGDTAPRSELDRARQVFPGRVGDWVFAEGVDVDIAVTVVTGDVAGQVVREAKDAALVVVGVPTCPEHELLPAQLADRVLCPVAMVGESGDVTLLEARPSR